jgi:hypothetical protein
MLRGASLTNFNADGIPQCRPMLYRCWDGSRLVFAWLMTNPSVASHLIDDPTCGRTVTTSDDHGGGMSLLGNMWSWRTPYPRDLWTALAAGRITEDMILANERALELIGGAADRLVVAFGAEPMRRHPEHCRRMLGAFTRYNSSPLLCLGTTDDGMPLHPLARGKSANAGIPPQPYIGPYPIRSGRTCAEWKPIKD